MGLLLLAKTGSIIYIGLWVPIKALAQNPCGVLLLAKAAGDTVEQAALRTPWTLPSVTL